MDALTRSRYKTFHFSNCEIAQGLIDFSLWQDPARSFIEATVNFPTFEFNESISIYSKVHYAHFEQFG
jgi:hypothetical protein